MTSRFQALEKNILKYRAIQMVLLLHEVESFRYFLIGSIRATDQLNQREPRLPAGAKRPMEQALAVLVTEMILSESEVHDIQAIIKIRNQVGHAVHELVDDITQPHWFDRSESQYDYSTLERFERLRDKAVRGMMKGFVLQMDLRSAAFQAAGITYKEELNRLRSRINRQYVRRCVTV